MITLLRNTNEEREGEIRKSPFQDLRIVSQHVAHRQTPTRDSARSTSKNNFVPTARPSTQQRVPLKMHKADMHEFTELFYPSKGQQINRIHYEQMFHTANGNMARIAAILYGTKGAGNDSQRIGAKKANVTVKGITERLTNNLVGNKF